MLTYSFTYYAILSMLFLSAISGVVGSYVVLRRMVFATGGVTHASFGGIGLAYYCGFSPTLGALLFAVATALGIEVASERGGVRHDSAIAMLWSLGMAVGIIFMSLVPGYAPSLMGYMFGDVLAVSVGDVVANGVFAVVCVLLSTVFYRYIMYTAFDSQYARIAKWRPRVVSLASSVVVALAISLSIKAVGIILVLSVFSIPQTIALMFTKRYSGVMLLSGLIAFVASMVGLWVSFVFDMPTGAVVSALLSLIFLVIKGFGYIRKVF